MMVFCRTYSSLYATFSCFFAKRLTRFSSLTSNFLTLRCSGVSPRRRIIDAVVMTESSSSSSSSSLSSSSSSPPAPASPLSSAFASTSSSLPLSSSTSSSPEIGSTIGLRKLDLVRLRLFGLFGLEDWKSWRLEVHLFRFSKQIYKWKAEHSQPQSKQEYCCCDCCDWGGVEIRNLGLDKGWTYVNYLQ